MRIALASERERKSAGPFDFSFFFFFAVSSLLLDQNYRVMKGSHSTPETSGPILKRTT